MNLSDIWTNPPASHSPVPIWWWSGEPLKTERLFEQLREMANAGIHNVCIINLAPTSPLFNCDPDDPPFMSEAWWDIFTTVCTEAKRLDVRIWFYDQLGFSGANFQAGLVRDDPDLSGWWLESVQSEGNDPVVSCPAAGEGVAAFAWEAGSDEPVRVPIENRSASVRGKARLQMIYSVRRGFDYFNVVGCARLINTVHGEFERRLSDLFGTTIVGSFQDELPGLPTWTEDFSSQFKQICGYDMTDKLWELFEGGPSNARSDYHRVRSELGERALFRPLFDFHERNGLICGFDQTFRDGDPAPTTSYYADYPRTHRWYAAPGSDHMGDAKIHSSLAHSYDRPRVWIEGFHSTGWGGTLAQTYDWLIPWLRAGANLYNPHAVYYSTRGGWWEWAAPSTCWRQPYWEHYKTFADATTRLCAALSLGHHVCDVAVLYPSDTVQASSVLGSREDPSGASRIYQQLVGRMYWWGPQAGILDEANCDFEVLVPDIAAQASVDSGQLHWRDESWRFVILPGCQRIDASVADKLTQFVASGGTLVAVGCAPAKLQHLFDAGEATLVVDPAEVTAELSQIDRTVEASAPVLHRRSGDTDIVLVTAGPATQQLEGSGMWGRTNYTWDASRYKGHVELKVKGARGPVTAWDPITGSREALASVTDNNSTSVTVPLSGRPALVVVFGDDEPAPPRPPEKNTVIWTAPDVWEATCIPTMDNTHGDFALPAGSDIGVQTWDFTNAAGATVHATFGAHGTWRIEDGDEVHPAEWSMTRGIYKDSLHNPGLGPKAHVPEEFLDFGLIEPGQTVVFTTTVTTADPQSLTVGVGSSADKVVVINGNPLSGLGDGYMFTASVHLQAGDNDLEIHFTVPEQPQEAPVHVPNTLRAFFAFATGPDAFDRPEWMYLPGASVAGSRVIFEHVFDVPDNTTGATIQIGGEVASRLLVNETEVGRQGGFLPYAIPTVQPYRNVALNGGRNHIAVEITDVDRPTSVLCDIAIATADGQTLVIASGRDWTVHRDDDEPQPVALRASQLFDPPFAHLTRRPHPLPGSAWLDPVDDRIVDFEIGCRTTTTELNWTLPPGAVRAHIPAIGQASLEVDGAPVPIVDGHADLPTGLTLAARLKITGPHPDGAALSGPITYETKTGQLPLGDWTQLGLTSWSGAVTYRTKFIAPKSGQPTWLDLGTVNGTAEVSINGQPAGALICPPWRLEITDLVSTGENAIEVTVRNTLGPYFDAVSPTRFAFKCQMASGLGGPVSAIT